MIVVVEFPWCDCCARVRLTMGVTCIVESGGWVVVGFSFPFCYRDGGRMPATTFFCGDYALSRRRQK